MTAVDYSAALCAQTDPDAFFPEKGGPIGVPKSVCVSTDRYGRPAPCPCRVSCLLDALANGDLFGVWGGMNVEERRALAREPLQGCEPPPKPVEIRRTPSRARVHPMSRGSRGTGARKV